MRDGQDKDDRGVWLETWVLDIVDQDYPCALVLAQLLWWHQPGKDGTLRVKYERDGHLWLLRPDEEWWDEVRLTMRQVRRARLGLTKLGFVEVKKFKRGGVPCSALRPLYGAIQKANNPNCGDSEVTSARQSHGGDAQASVPTDAQTSLPIGKSSRGKSSENSQGAKEAFERFWAVYPYKADVADAEKAWGQIRREYEGLDPESVIAGAERYANDPNRSDAYTKGPGAWLRAKAWENPPLPARGNNIAPVEGAIRGPDGVWYPQ